MQYQRHCAHAFKRNRRAATPHEAVLCLAAGRQSVRVESPGVAHIGEKAPDFSLTSESGEVVHLGAVVARRSVILIFYPMDDTSGCTAQLCAVRDDADRYAAADAVVYGVSGGDAASHSRFREKYRLSAPLLVDTGLVVSNMYGATIGIGPLKMIRRTVVGISPGGTIAFYKRGAPSTAQILAAFTIAVAPG